MLSSTNTNPTAPPNRNELLPRVPGEGHAPRAATIHQRQGKGREPRHRPVIQPGLSLPQAGHEVDRTKGAAEHAGPTGPPMATGNDTSSPVAASCGIPRRRNTESRMLLRRAGDPGMRAPPEQTRISGEKVKHQGTRSQGAHSGTTGEASGHVTLRECCEGHVPRSPENYQRQGARGGPPH